MSMECILNLREVIKSLNVPTARQKTEEEMNLGSPSFLLTNKKISERTNDET